MTVTPHETLQAVCIFITICSVEEIQVGARSEAWVCGGSLVEISGSNPARGHGYLSLVSVVCCKVGRSLRRADH
jgi:hypothetical protein